MLRAPIAVALTALMGFAGCQSSDSGRVTTSSAATKTGTSGSSTGASGGGSTAKGGSGGGGGASPAPMTAPAAASGVPRGVLTGIAGEPEVRVRLLAQATKVALSSPVRMVWVASAGSPRPPARMTAPVEARLNSGGWELTDATGLVARFERGSAVGIAAEEGVLGPATTEAGAPAGPVLARGVNAGSPRPTASARVLVNGKGYPGVIQLQMRSDVSPAAFDVIDRISMEEYVKGVVASEMFSGWPLAAYQAQAVAARSYALAERSRARSASLGFDLEAGIKDQAFGGASDNLLASKAVTDTRGVVLTWNAAALRAYYSSTCGGRPASARDTWPSSAGMEFNLAGPVQAQAREHACQPAGFYHWTVQRTKKDLTDRLKAYGRENGTPLKNLTGIESIRQAGVNAAGRPNRFLIVQPGGQTYLVTGEELRRACNQEGAGLPAITQATRVHSSDCEVVASGGGTGGGGNVLFTGRGFGHGVGLCQWCAKGFADKGEAWQQILARFYPGARLERVY